MPASLCLALASSLPCLGMEMGHHCQMLLGRVMGQSLVMAWHVLGVTRPARSSEPELSWTNQLAAGVWLRPLGPPEAPASCSYLVPKGLPGSAAPGRGPRCFCITHEGVAEMG